MSTATENGTLPVEAVDPIEAHASELEELLGPIEAERSQLEARLADLTERETRITVAIEALTGNVRKLAPALPARKPATAAKPKGADAKGTGADAKGADAKGTGSSNVWVPSQRVVDEVHACITEAAPESMSITNVATQLGKGRDTVAKAVEILRQAERVRITGTTNGGGRLYTVMP